MKLISLISLIGNNTILLFFFATFLFYGNKLNLITIGHFSFFFCSVLLPEFTKFADENPVLEFVQVPFNHPLFIMYSSGTTGPPKCLVHSVGVS